VRFISTWVPNAPAASRGVFLDIDFVVLRGTHVTDFTFVGLSMP
jgi:hypothetical protein